MKTLLEPESIGDAELVALCLNENRHAFASVIARYQSLICAIAYNACGDVGRSEDLAQETFITAWKGLRELKEPAQLKSWLCGIVRNLSRNSLRRDQRTPTARALSSPLPLEAPDASADPHEQAVSKEEEALVWRTLENLPADYRELMILFYREGQSAQAAAAALDLSEEAVWQRLSRGRAMLKEGVTKTVESALLRSAPGTAFLGATLAALPGFAPSAKAAASAVAVGGASAKTAAAFGTGGGLLGMLGFGYFSMRAQVENTKSPRERQFIKRLIWVRTAVMIIVVALLFGLRALNHAGNPLMHDPLVRKWALPTGGLGLAIYAVVIFEVTYRRRRQIQKEDGTFEESDWMVQEKPRELWPQGPGEQSKARVYRLLAIGTMFSLVTIPLVFHFVASGHLGSALLWVALMGTGAYRGLRRMQRLPRFDARSTVFAGLGMLALLTISVCYAPLFFGLFGQTFAGSGNPLRILLYVAVALTYSALLWILARLHERRRHPR